jgi:hypothetical protein
MNHTRNDLLNGDKMTDQKDAISGAIEALEKVGICIDLETVHNAIDEALSQLRELQADYVLVRKEDIPDDLWRELSLYKQREPTDGLGLYPRMAKAAALLHAANGGE